MKIIASGDIYKIRLLSGQRVTEEVYKGKLFVVSTPIGNLEDISLRALRILKEVDLIACEDTRRTRKLLSFYQIPTPCTSYFEGNRVKKGNYILSQLKMGRKVALVSEAGTPGISDPGQHLVALAVEEGIPVSPIPGPSALTAALSISGIRDQRFFFQGFLPIKGKKRTLERLKDIKSTLVFYESPRRVQATLEDILAALGDRYIVVTRELTKLFEEVQRGKVSEVLSRLGNIPLRGEVTLLISSEQAKH